MQTQNPIMDVEKIRQILPHRYPMLLVDRVVELVRNSNDTKPDGYIKAYKNVTINEEVFLGHFPSKPIYPGVMQIEGMAQAGGLLAFVSMFGDNVAEAENKIVYFMTIDNVKFRIPVVPGDRLVYELKVLKHKGSVWQLGAKAFVDDKLVSEAELKAMIADAQS
ncbi:3-hydroxyacyl-ACP dehydratase FabZ [Helicobacter cinaedi]|uniref:3-hydroxyacyl-[acyl-carrier-protein] dehydratase FabZ n=2 Tax=Helicobacter cinaedi TaxID=213 RepID=A0AAI8MQE6_9HELI|nr:3-hydroxyacyl-ACP dehydratase FabZ [Helicobacter cinaedi]AWK62611.1 3-hydroxyacyl-[acyl-carrier-protein] dehydratase FabZ [Helicobacter cinaedi]EFR46182.1 beta-hydroxyacyl-(acyl-carrier-protein) dehydratase FabZ [Helicobacter cinaedi CCUG 18818 = ATCC BAA-847]QOQ90584.1 3-hydroxyacyl-ACP dehydratase FabZ [Helicobacter cinaedi]QOQ96754.1 3-hydroxyacyl-ACP dehydratase FabZ [Helicobacter cinaedi]STP11837.1 (3R)-hydroxymyristoyl-ACP dehydratase [Helicobacter cinaedi]